MGLERARGPSWRKTNSSPTALALGMLCVTTTSVVFDRFFKSTSSESISAAVTGSSPAPGSSASNTGGSSARARASPARFFMPPDRSAGILSHLALEPDLGEQTARSLADLAARMPGVPAHRELHVDSDTDRVEERGVLKEESDPLPDAGQIAAGHPSDVLAFDEDRPESGRTSPTMCLSATLLPVPLRPRMHTLRPAATVKHTSSSMFRPSKDLVT